MSRNSAIISLNVEKDLIDYFKTTELVLLFVKSTHYHVIIVIKIVK